MRVLQIRDLKVAFGSAEVVHGVNLHVDRGETVALVGESGSGKSVTALSVLKLLNYPPANHPGGSIEVNGRELLDAPPDVLREVRGKAVSMVFQEPMTSLNPLHIIGRQIAEVMHLHADLSREASKQRTVELLERVGLRNAVSRLDAWPHELSGGERQRVMIAMALANKPDLLIADEPTTALDATIQRQILGLLKDLQAEFGMAMLLITHDLGVVRYMADRVYVMRRGLIVEQGTREKLFAEPDHPYTRELIEAEPKGEAPPLPTHASSVIQVRNLQVDYAIGKGWFGRTGKRTAVQGVHLAICRGETVGIVGESGSGKTTLGLALLRLITSSGEVLFHDKPIHALAKRTFKPLRRNLQIVFQDPYGSLSPRLTVRDIVAEGLEVHEPGLTESEVDTRVAAVLGDVGLEPGMMSRYPHEFSGGQRQRIAIARALILRPEVIVLDEPTSALDVSVQAQIIELLRDLQQRLGLAYLFVSHDLKVVRALAHHIIVMRDGRVVEEGPPARIFDAPQSEYTRALIGAAL
ncbi:MAG: ABC transporter ATP-binding protein [Gammaproteobacteria bacterium]|nr:ABC transporter ATP-binding protein [Gammaproteobacteria bacterium]